MQAQHLLCMRWQNWWPHDFLTCVFAPQRRRPLARLYHSALSKGDCDVGRMDMTAVNEAKEANRDRVWRDALRYLSCHDRYHGSAVSRGLASGTKDKTSEAAFHSQSAIHLLLHGAVQGNCFTASNDDNAR